MKLDKSLEIIQNNVSLRDMILKNCLTVQEQEQLKQKDRETVKKMLEK